MRWVVLVAALASCQPYYRDDERRGRAARDPHHLEVLLRDASAASARGDHREAAQLAVAALDAHPGASTSTWVQAATYLAAAGDAVGARALVAYRRSWPEGSDDGELRGFLVASYLSQQLLANAITAAGVTSYDDLVQRTDLRVTLTDLIVAHGTMNDDPAGALTSYLDWLRSYGDPDHEVLRTTAEEIQRVLAGRIEALGQLPARARAALDRGDLATAAVLVSEIYRVLPGASEHRALFAAVAAAVSDPSAIDPVAYQLALDGDQALRDRDVGEAIHRYRQAVAQAPWWAHARQNLALLLESVDEPSGQGHQEAWLEVLSSPEPVH